MAFSVQQQWVGCFRWGGEDVGAGEEPIEGHVAFGKFVGGAAAWSEVNGSSTCRFSYAIVVFANL